MNGICVYSRVLFAASLAVCTTVPYTLLTRYSFRSRMSCFKVKTTSLRSRGNSLNLKIIIQTKFYDFITHHKH